MYVKTKTNWQKEWHNEVNKKPKLRTCVNFKTENYVSAYMLRSHRSLLAQF